MRFATLLIGVFIALPLTEATTWGQDPKLPRTANGADEAIFAQPPDVTYFVDPSRGSDSRGSGVAERPLKTLGRALRLATRSYTRGSKVRIELRPGKYREEDFFDAERPSSKGYLHIVASEKHQAIITGMDDWTGTEEPWAKEVDGSFSKRWTMNWGFEKRGQVHGPYPEFDESLITRREWVVMNNDQVVRQVLKRESMEPGTFFVDDETSQLFVMPPGGLDPNRDLIEVATRPNRVLYQGWMWTFWNIENLKFEGLRFTGAAPFPNGANLHLGRGCENVVIEDCRFDQNGTGGFNFAGDDTSEKPEFYGVTAVTVRRCEASNNGTSGFHGGLVDGVFVDNRFERNNVRGDWAGTSGWAIAGAKFVGTRGLSFHDNLVLDNRTGGLWLDILCSDISVQGCKINDNVGKDSSGKTQQRGIFVEICDGPVLIERSEISGNHIGIQVGNSHDVTIRDCKIVNNLLTQIGLESRPRGDEFPAHNERLIITDNYIASLVTGAMLVRQIWSEAADNLEPSLAGLKSTRCFANRYETKDPSSALMAMDLSKDEPVWRTMTFNQWKRMTGFDAEGSTLNQQTAAGASAGSPISGEQFDDSEGVTAFNGGFGDLGENNGKSDWVCYHDFDFGDATDRVTITMGVPESHAGGKIEIRTGSVDGPLLGTLNIESTGDWSTRKPQTIAIKPTSGCEDVFLIGRDASVVGNVYEILFSGSKR